MPLLFACFLNKVLGVLTGAGSFYIRIGCVAAQLVVEQHADRWRVVVVELPFSGGPQIGQQKTCSNHEADEDEQKHNLHKRKL